MLTTLSLKTQLLEDFNCMDSFHETKLIENICMDVFLG